MENRNPPLDTSAIPFFFSPHVVQSAAARLLTESTKLCHVPPILAAMTIIYYYFFWSCYTLEPYMVRQPTSLKKFCPHILPVGSLLIRTCLITTLGLKLSDAQPRAPDPKLGNSLPAVPMFYELDAFKKAPQELFVLTFFNFIGFYLPPIPSVSVGFLMFLNGTV